MAQMASVKYEFLDELWNDHGSHENQQKQLYTYHDHISRYLDLLSNMTDPKSNMTEKVEILEKMNSIAIKIVSEIIPGIMNVTQIKSLGPITKSSMKKYLKNLENDQNMSRTDHFKQIKEIENSVLKLDEAMGKLHDQMSRTL